MNLQLRLAFALAFIALLFPFGARAMTVHDFGRLNNDDEASFVTLLVESSRDYLKGQGKPDQGAKVIELFKTPGHEGGVYKFADNLKAADASNKHNAINPNNRIKDAQVEDAMALTLKDAGFVVPVAYLMTAAKTFRPSGIPRLHAPGT